MQSDVSKLDNLLAGSAVEHALLGELVGDAFVQLVGDVVGHIRDCRLIWVGESRQVLAKSGASQASRG